MNHNKKVLLTKDGLDHLKKEHEELVKVKRPEAVKRLAQARDLGDLMENSEYTAASQDLSLIDERIAKLEELLRGAKVVAQTKGRKNEVSLGCKVIVEINKKKKSTYSIVGEWEVDPAKKKISPSSPLGKALMGKKVGDEVLVEVPAGKTRYKIIDIR